jgi:hypothetical protein
VTRLVLQFLKAGVLTEDQFTRSEAGTPQGGIISPLLANIALSAIEERYPRWVHKRPAQQGLAPTAFRRAASYARQKDRRKGRMVCYPIRYADDFVVLVHGSRTQAEAELNALAEHLRTTLGLELSAEKTRLTPITESFEFLGHRIRLKSHPHRGLYTALEIPKHKAADLRHRIKRLTGRSHLRYSLSWLLRRLNRVLCGWANFYRHCSGAHRVFGHLDWYTWHRLWRWLRKKYPKTSAKRLFARYQGRSRKGRRKVLQEAGVEQFLTDRLRVERYRLAWLRHPDYAMTSGEPDA